jgi:hypothetical protein
VIHETRQGVYVMRNGKVVEEIDPAPSMQGFEVMMRLDPEYENAVRQEILLAAHLNCRYR